MRALKTGWLISVVVVLSLLVFSCSGGGTSTNPQLPDPGEGGPPSGDPPESVTLGFNPGPFTIPGGFGDLRGVAASTDYVYVADSTTVYAFDKAGTFINFAAAPATVKALAVLPPAPDIDIPNDPGYDVANFPVILHDPVPQYGYVTIYPPNLDPGATREDVGAADANRQGSLPPFGIMDPPNQDAPYLCMAVYDMTVDRFGSILLTADIDYKGIAPTPDWPHALQVLDRLNGYTPAVGGTFTVDDGTGTGNVVTLGVPCFHVALGSPGPAIGDNGDGIGPGSIATLGNIATDTFFPFNRPDTEYTLYIGAANFLRDYVGVAQMTVKLESLNDHYFLSQMVDNGFGYLRVIGNGTGSAPGSFSANPPINPDGGLEDPDLTNGGPSGMITDPLTDNIYVTDPGNRRVQMFDGDTGEFLGQIGDGTRGRAGSSFLAPSSIGTDYNGNIWICDVSDLRILREGGDPDYKFGNIGGTVRRLDTGNTLEGTTITVGNEFGAIDFRTSNINGDYQFSNLLVGSYFLSASKFNYDSDTTTANVIADQTVRIDFNLNPRTQATTGSYTGHIVDANTNLDLEGVTIQIVNTSLTTVSDSLGGFVILNIQPGTYQALFTKDGYETLTRDVQINAGVATTDPTLEMTPLPLL